MRLLVLLFGFMMASGAAQAQDCTSPDGTIGSIIYNADHDLFQGCTSQGWWSFHEYPTNPCTGTTSDPSIGDTCDDGSIYAGLSPDGNVAMYTTPADQSTGAYWGTEGFETGATSTSTGATNSADVYAHVQSGDGNFNPDDRSTPNAFVLCEELVAHTQSDWYLPSQEELNTLYQNRILIGGFDTSGSPRTSEYWSSSEDVGDPLYSAHLQRFSDGLQAVLTKDELQATRCVRK